MEASEKDLTEEEKEICAKLMLILQSMMAINLKVGFVKALHKPTGKRHLLLFYQYKELDVPIMKVLGNNELDDYLSPGAEENLS